LTLILTGLVKKVAIADVIEPRVRQAFESTAQMDPASLLIGICPWILTDKIKLSLNLLEAIN